MSLEEERKYDELEGLPFIKALMADKKYDEVIKQFPALTKKESDLGELYYYLGESHFFLKEFSKAKKVLQKAQKFHVPEQFYALYGNVEFQLKNFKSCSRFFNKMNPSNIKSQDWQIYYECLEKSGEHSHALELSLNYSSSDEDFFLEAQKLFLKYQLHEMAFQKQNEFLKSCRPADFYLKLWSIFENQHSPDIAILEKGHACYPKSSEITAVLIKELFQKGAYHSIAYLFDVMSAEDKLYVKHAAEFYKVAGRYVVADYFFSLSEEKDFIMARSSYYLDHENYAALISIPYKGDLLKSNKDLAYALAYSHFKFLSLEKSLHAISAGANFGRGDQLIQLVHQCEKLDWRCRP
ncbi:MAG: tetratricopeptide repeat protein [Bacteriovoracaceae bacterium]